jgi:ABC-type microcin C transport system permease subunit YejE
MLAVILIIVALIIGIVIGVVFGSVVMMYGFTVDYLIGEIIMDRDKSLFVELKDEDALKLLEKPEQKYVVLKIRRK